ncbi:MAG: deoxyribodipyrimidine photo-lyase [Candidatus Izemoplasmatales bacterium]|nr:deoxyribodipyrimidine photo-lyase [bacterium]MDZ4197000.1 deoxyribodipyrimidine photo-lyase [Candidatus Izemoplasmatales bacterium]
MSRIQTLIQAQTNSNSKYILYWMQQAQRVHYNQALDFAISLANKSKLPLLVLFVLTPSYPLANRRHYYFMLEGLKEVQTTLQERQIPFVIRLGIPDQVVTSYLADCFHLVMDNGYTSIQRSWRKSLYQTIIEHVDSCSLTVVDTDLIIPIKVASNKAEYGAYTIRPKINRLLPEYLDYPNPEPYLIRTPLPFSSDVSLSTLDELISTLPIDQTILPSAQSHGGYSEAKKRLEMFLTKQIHHYIEANDPSNDYNSKLSAYLHFGQISSLDIYHECLKHASSIPSLALESFLEQLVVRRELAFNFIFYTPHYDSLQAITEPWAIQTMEDHINDKREYLYSIEEFKQANTHDIYWNACMKEMVLTGYMPNYMRMYWAKKIIEWTIDYQTAYEIIQTLNDSYFLDGRDANSYAGIAWCFGKHDRAWTNRPIFGKLRYMNQAGLLRKFDMDKYVSYVESLSKSLS